MKHFVVEVTYIVPIAQIDALLPAHRAFLQGGYDQGMLLMSGPQNPRRGGIIVARAESLEALQAFFANDPYQQAGIAAYRWLEFDPVKRQSWLEDWVSGG